jgi:DNA-binding response OmpR family regulator
VRILVVEDEEPIAAGIRDVLGNDGHAVDIIADGGEAMRWAGAYPYDLVVLDVVLPTIDGLEICGRLRGTGFAAPILMLTALDAVEDRVAGLDQGADDYLAKPFAMAELRARVRALLRRHAPDRSPSIRVGELELDPVTRGVRRGDRDVRLTAREFALLEFLARHAGQVFSQPRLIDAVWSADFTVESNVVEVYIRSLRRKIDGGRRDGLIETVRGVGYRLRAHTAG